ncbi:hypothetical protein [Sphingosinicella microcystinivorans]|uniref:Uncharacterized protein n=1 Tax=Sphingosinicella microcystinivorans TaxID=335406 RepID=A0AAD1FZ60_SPHMI|nr:hypothetical protein [Sphingosinicella microcystinivorans]RKS88867.1 hypothetical protein DFR51_2078 [Sphingosinicella microcystinivorans]BBE32622.1 hypothetical protein SmB9_02800 [Sphingosinicella microcystinivorans]
MTATERRTLAFANAFTIGGVDGLLPAGEYQVEVDTDSISDDGSSPKTVSAFLYVRRGGKAYAFEVDAEELDRVHAAARKKSENTQL